MDVPKPIKILYMEDDLGLARLMQRNLTKNGYSVDIAPDGEAGLAMAETGSYGVILVDHKMPKLTGLQVISALASRGTLPATVMITGTGSESIAVEALKLGADDYVVKDVDGHYLNLISSVIEKARERQRLKKDKERAEKALAEEKELLAVTLRSIADAVITTDVESRLVSMNAEAERMTGWTEQEAKGRDIADIIDIRDYKTDEPTTNPVKRLLDSANNGGPMRNGSLKSRNGTSCAVSHSTAPIKTDDGDTVGTVLVLRDISEQKRTLETLEFERAQLLSIFDSINAMVNVIDPRTHEILYMNKYTESLVGTDRQGRPCYEVIHNRANPCSLCTNEAAADLRGGTYSSDYYSESLGRHFMAMNRMITWPDGRDVRFELLWDITDRKRAEAECVRSEQAFRLAFENARDAIVWADARTREILRCNKAAEDLFGRSREHIVGLCQDVVFPPEEKEAWGNWLRDVIDGKESPETDGDIITEQGERVPVRVSTSVTSIGDEKVAQSIFADITAMKKAENLALQSVRYNVAAEMAWGAAHQFNNWLHVVLGGTQLALQHAEAGRNIELTQNLLEILESAKRGAQMIKRLRDFAWEAHGSPNLPERSFDLTQTVQEALEMTKAWWKTGPEGHGIEIRLEQSLEQDCIIHGNENDLFEVAVCLIKNAAEAMEHGGTISVYTERTGDTIRMKVRDTGVGIDEANMPKVFIPFWTTKTGEGRGLGLASAFGIVQRHKGTITVESERDRGTELTVAIPYAQIVPEDDVQTTEPAPVQSLRILIVDDMEAVLRMLKLGFKKLNQTVLPAVSGKDALEIFRTEHIDAVVCDLAMPEINGWEVGRVITELCMEQSRPKPPFIMLTGWGQGLNEPSKMAESGVDRVVEKPAEVQTLLNIIRDLL